MAIPVIALVVVTSVSSGGVDGLMITLERAIRHGVTSVIDVLRNLF